MESITISLNELKKLMRETFIDVLKDRKDLIEEAVKEFFSSKEIFLNFESICCNCSSSFLRGEEVTFSHLV